MSQPTLETLLSEACLSKIVYSLVMPETVAAIDRVLDGQGRDAYHSLFQEAWTQKQDRVHEDFFALWRDWVKPIVHIPSEFQHGYPTAGASEAIREVMHAHCHSSIERPFFHVFEGEYEGFTAYAQAMGAGIAVHPRAKWREVVEHIGLQSRIGQSRPMFLLSEPSAIDGAPWTDHAAFLQALHQNAPQVPVMLDLTYVGCVHTSFQIYVTPNVSSIVFSLSKPCGAYYYRIGGALTRNPLPALFGNKWFKNLLSLQIGTEMMKTHGVFELPRKYHPVQKQAVEMANAKLGLKLSPAPVFVLATAQPTEEPLSRFLTRGSANPIARVCVTPLMAGLIQPSLNPHVRPRYYEAL